MSWLWSGNHWTWDDIAVWVIWVPLLLVFTPIFLVSLAAVAVFEVTVRALAWLTKGVR